MVAAGESTGGDAQPVEIRPIRALTLLHLKRSFDLFSGNHGNKYPLDEDSQRVKIACKIRDEYAAVKDRQPSAAPKAQPADRLAALLQPSEAPEIKEKTELRSTTAKLIESIKEPAHNAAVQKAIVLRQNMNTALVPTATGGHKEYMPSAQLQRRIASKWPRPKWHPPWKLYRVIAGHLGWVRSIAFDPSNEWFCTGSADRTIKIWDTASGKLRLTLTGHIEQVTGLAVSPRMPYMFSCGLDKTVKCWDLEYNKVIRSYHGHLSGVYSLTLHPTVDVLLTGGRDSTCRVWDIRTKVQVHCLSGHDETVCSILSQAVDPQVITGSHDKTIRFWDLRKGKTMQTLTYHKKSVRAMVLHPTEYAFASASADNIKKFKLPSGDFLHNMLQQHKTIVNCMAINEDGVMVSGGNCGSLWFWDWMSGNKFQAQDSIVQPGSLESEAGIFAMSFDVTGSRLVTCEADKSIKLFKEDLSATPESHPIDFRPPKDIKRF